MVSFDGFHMEGGSPIYRQLLLYIKRGAVAGSIADGDALPSRRVLSALLGVNPNTVQKAYRLLEEEGLLVSRTGAASCMALDGEKLAALREQLLAADALRAAGALKQLGLRRAEALALIDKYWEEADGNEAAAVCAGADGAEHDL